MIATTRTRRCMAFAAGAAMLMATDALAQEACNSMQVLLSIAPKHREHVMEMIAPRLKEKFGVDLVTEAIGSATMVERVTAQRENPRISIAQWDAPIGLTACQTGLCKPIDLSRAPNAGKLFDWAYTHDAQGRVMVMSTNVLGVGFIYNERELKRHNIAPPTAWADLTRPDLRGRLAITAPQSSMGTAALVMLARIGGGGETNIEPGFAATKAIMRNVHTVFTWSSELSNLMQLGEVWVAVNSSNIAVALREQGVPTHFMLPREGSPTVNGGLSLVAGGPCEAAAYEYINLYYSDEFQLRRMREGGTASPAKSPWTQLTPAERENMGVTAADFDKLVNLDWNAINEARPGWIQRWQREIR